MQKPASQQLPCPAGYAIQKLKAFLDVGAIGEVIRINLERLSTRRVASGPGAGWRFTPRDVAVLLYLMGEPPEAVAVHGVNLMRPGAYDDLHLELGFTRDRSAHIHASCCWPDPRGSIHVFGHRGMIVYEEAHQTLVLHRRFLAGDLGPDPLELLDFGSFHLLEDPWRVPGPADQPAAGEGNGTGPDGPVDPEVLRVLQRTELQLEHSKCI